jgi:hypothetical protein
MDLITFLVFVISCSLVIVLALAVSKRIIKARADGPESDVSKSELRNFAIGFFIWPMLNGIFIYVVNLIVQANTCHACGFGPEMFAFMLKMCLIALINFGVLIFLLIKRHWWVVFGILACAPTAGILFPVFRYFTGQ